MAITSTHAHAEPLRKMTPAASDAGVNVNSVGNTKNTLMPQNSAPPKTAESDGRAPRANTPSATTKPTTTSRGTPVISNSPDRTRVQAKAPTSPMPVNPFVPLTETKIGTLRAGEIDHLAAHGVTPGLVGGVFCLKRQYVPAAEGLVAQVRRSS